MTGHFYDFVYLPFVGWLLAISILVVGYLIYLQVAEICRIRTARRLSPSRRGMTILVRGLGLRSELSPNWQIGASQTRTVSEIPVSSQDSTRTTSPAQTQRQNRGSVTRRPIIIGTVPLQNPDFLDSAGRG